MIYIDPDSHFKTWLCYSRKLCIPFSITTMFENHCPKKARNLHSNYLLFIYSCWRQYHSLKREKLTVLLSEKVWWWSTFSNRIFIPLNSPQSFPHFHATCARKSKTRRGRRSSLVEVHCTVNKAVRKNAKKKQEQRRKKRSSSRSDFTSCARRRVSQELWCDSFRRSRRCLSPSCFSRLLPS